MSKYIAPAELGAIVMALLADPVKMGQFDSTETFNKFFRDIGEVVANYCGADVDYVSESAISLFDMSEDAVAARNAENLEDTCLPMLTLSPNDSMSSPQGGVWASFDPQGWDGEAPMLDSEAAEDERAAIQEIVGEQLPINVLRKVLARAMVAEGDAKQSDDASFKM